MDLEAVFFLVIKNIICDGYDDLCDDYDDLCDDYDDVLIVVY
jgi:hypothetical protein